MSGTTKKCPHGEYVWRPCSDCESTLEQLLVAAEGQLACMIENHSAACRERDAAEARAKAAEGALAGAVGVLEHVEEQLALWEPSVKQSVALLALVRDALTAAKRKP